MNIIPNMSYAEKMARAKSKKEIILKFLASGEVFSTVNVLATLLQMSRAVVLTCLNSMITDGSIKSESHRVDAHNLLIYGITSHGLALADQLDNPHFELGRTNSNFISHRIDGQIMRLKAENMGFTDWTPERVLRLKSGNNTLKKVPDALCIAPGVEHYRCAIEIERSVKMWKRYQEIIPIYLTDITAKRLDIVYYLSPDGLEKRVEKTFRKVAFVKLNGESVKLEERHFSRFKFISFFDFCRSK